MKFQHRSYGGKIFRPKPEILVEENGNLLIIATPWGERGAASKAIQSIQDFFLSSQADLEVTAPFSVLSCLSPAANRLRAAMMLTNDILHDGDNKNEYISGIEILAIIKDQNELSWVQIGNPSLYLDRANKNIEPLGHSIDLSFEFQSPNSCPSPLPNELLGIYDTSNFSIRSLRAQSDDRIILASHSGVNSSFFSLSRENRSLTEFSKALSQASPNKPFWIGIWSPF